MQNSEFTPAEMAMIEQEFQSLIDIYAHTTHRQHVERIEQAFRFANKAHYGVRRLSGEPYIMHPLAVAKIVVSEIGLGSTSISAALLHDVVEDTDYTVEDIDNLFGAKIAQIVDGLTKISGGVFGDKASEQAENFRKLLLTMSDDIRVVLIKIADRLHNMRTLSAQPIEKQYKIAGETQYIYAPLAHRLGLGSIKSELENLSFKYEHPDTYAELAAKIEEDHLARMENFERFAKPIREKLTMLGYEYDLTARIKTPYSIWNKMNTKHVSFDEVYDLLAVRIVFTPNQSLSEKDQCWMIYSAITEIYRPHPGRIRDWISTPKANGYEALHVTVMGHDGEWVEIQIRTRRMHELAEQGLAAHWKYKTGVMEDSELDKWLRDIKEILASESPDAMTFLDTFKLNLFAKEVFVFTPNGDIQTLPQGATVLDLAYQLHSELGEHCIGAKVNHALKSSDYVLHAGDQVEVLTAEQQQPTPEWLNYVTTAKAQSALNIYFRKQERQKELIGERRLIDALRTLLIPEDQYDGAIQRLQNHYHLTKRSELYKQIGIDAIKLDAVKEIIFPKKSLWARFTPWRRNDNQLSIGDNQLPEVSDQSSDSTGQQPAQKSKAPRHFVLTDENIKDVILEPCCKPIPGDEVIGFKDATGKMHIHYLNCPVAERLKSSYGKSIYSVAWDTHRINLYNEKLEIEGIDQFGLLIEMLRVISENFHINIHDLHITANNGVFSAKIEIYVYDKSELYELMDSLKKMHNIQSVKRVFD